MRWAAYPGGYARWPVRASAAVARERKERPKAAGTAPDSSSELKEGGRRDWMAGVEGLRPAANGDPIWAFLLCFKLGVAAA